MAEPNVVVFRRAHILAVDSARAVCLGKLSSAASAKTQPWQGRTRRMNEALTTGIPYTVTQSVGFDHYYASGSQHMSRFEKSFLARPCLFGFDSVTPAQTSETSSGSQGGAVLWFRASPAQRARESQSQAQLHCSL